MARKRQAHELREENTSVSFSLTECEEQEEGCTPLPLRSAQIDPGTCQHAGGSVPRDILFHTPVGPRVGADHKGARCLYVTTTKKHNLFAACSGNLAVIDMSPYSPHCVQDHPSIANLPGRGSQRRPMRSCQDRARWPYLGGKVFE